MSTIPRRPSATVVTAAWPRAAFLAILSGVLMLGGLSAPPAVATGPAATVTVLTPGPGSPVVGQTIVLRATVTAAGQPVPVGHVTFDAAPTEEALWGADGYEPPYPAPTDVTLGQVAVGPDGIAELSLTLDAETIGFLRSGTALYLAAQYQPYELAGTGIYDQEYAASTSAAAQLVPEARPAVPTTVQVTGPDAARAAKATTLTAQVAPSSAQGSVRFRVDGTPVGAWAPVTAGSASTTHTFAAEGSAVVTAEFFPTDPTAYLPSTAAGRTIAVGASVPTLTLTGVQLWGWWQAGARYGSVSDGAALQVASGAVLLLEASAGLPGGREPTGTLRIAVDGTERPSEMALLEVERRTYVVTVSFHSTDPSIGSVTESFAVVGNPPAAPTATTLEVEPRLVRGEKWVRATVKVKTADGSSPPGRVQFTGFWFGSKGEPVRLRNGVATADFRHDDLRVNLPNAANSHPLGAVFLADNPLEHAFSSADEQNLAWLSWPTPGQAASGRPVGEAKVRIESANCQGGNTTVDVAVGGPGVGLVLADLATSTGSCGAAARAAGDRATSRVTCLPTARGYTCPVGTLVAGTRFGISGRFPLPATAAGRKLKVTATATSTDPVTGAMTTLATRATTLKVPKRTVLSASLAPRARKTVSVKRGKAVPYRIMVRNTGIVTAGQIRACVTLSAGARVAAARGAQVRGRRACWTLPTLGKGKAVSRTLVLVAPKRRGKLTVVLAVVPKKSQAAPVRLTASLPVR